MHGTEQSHEMAPATQPADVAPAADDPPESLEKVRDILFGGQLREVEARIQRVDERLRQAQESMRVRLEQQIAELEASTLRVLQSLDERFTAERRRRAEDLQTLGAQLSETIESLADRQSRLEETLGAGDAEMRDLLFHHGATMTAELERLSERLTSELQREVGWLRADKVGVAALADVFSDVVERLGGDARAREWHGPRS